MIGLTVQSTIPCARSTASTTCHAGARSRGTHDAITAAIAIQMDPPTPAADSSHIT